MVGRLVTTASLLVTKLKIINNELSYHGFIAGAGSGDLWRQALEVLDYMEEDRGPLAFP